MSSVLAGLARPIVAAPMAGGPSTPALAAAVSGAGGLGFLAAGYRTAEQMLAELDAARARTDRPLGVNLFAAGGPPADPDRVAAYAARLRPEADRLGVALGDPRHDDDALASKLEALIGLPQPPAVVSCTFGLLPAAAVAALRERGSEVWTTVTSADEARRAADGGADALVVQGREAGGHRGGFDDDDRHAAGLPLLTALATIRSAAPERSLVAAGGLMNGTAIAVALAAGAVAAQVGTAFLLTPEAGTSAVHRAAVGSAIPTVLTRAFSGRTARGVRNRLHDQHGAHAPAAYPELHHLTVPLRAAARDRGDASVVNLWAGEAHALVRSLPAADLTRRLADEARAAAAGSS